MGINFSTIHQRTDGCAAQYKSRNLFGDVSNFERNFDGISYVASFSASGHGKGEVDSAAGYLKTSARRAVTTNPDAPILTANDLFKYASDKLSNTPASDVALHKRHFFFVPKSQCEEVRERNRPTYFTITGTRKIHSVAGQI